MSSKIKFKNGIRNVETKESKSDRLASNKLNVFVLCFQAGKYRTKLHTTRPVTIILARTTRSISKSFELASDVKIQKFLISSLIQRGMDF